MKHAYKDDSFGARLDSAAGAKQAALSRIKAIAKPGDPEFEKRRQERQAIAAAREARQGARPPPGAAGGARRAPPPPPTHPAPRGAAAGAAPPPATEEQERGLAIEAEKIQRKADRDARYAARKARQR